MMPVMPSSGFLSGGVGGAFENGLPPLGDFWVAHMLIHDDVIVELF